MSGVSWEFEIIFSPQALRDLKSLEKNVQVRIKKAVEGLACFPPKGDVAKLRGGQGELRLKVGDWRVIFEYAFQQRQVRILRVKHRREAYRK